MQVLQQRLAKHLGVVCRPDDRGNGGHSGFLAGAQSSLSGDQLVAVRSATNDDRLQEADLGDGEGQFGERLLVENGAGLTWIGLQCVDGNLRVYGTLVRRGLVRRR